MVDISSYWDYKSTNITGGAPPCMGRIVMYFSICIQGWDQRIWVALELIPINRLALRIPLEKQKKCG